MSVVHQAVANETYNKSASITSGHGFPKDDPDVVEKHKELQASNQRAVKELNRAESVAQPGGTSGTTKRKALLYPELPWGMPAVASVKTDGQTFLKVWEILTSLACLYVAFVIPLSLGFEKIYIKPGVDQCVFRGASHDGSLFATIRVIDPLIDLIFWVDIVINFLSARWELQKDPIPNWVLVDDLHDIASRYMQELFVFDIIGSFPVQYLDCIDDMPTSSLKVLRLIRLTKLFRLYRIKNMILNLQEAFPKSVVYVTGFQLLLYFSLGAHWCACLFFALTLGMGDPKSEDPYVQHLFFNGWALGDGFLDENGEHVQYTADPWLSSLYWAVTTMSTIGYGDISPGTIPERIMGMFLMSAGCAFFAWITGKITQLLTDKSAGETRFEEAIEELDSFMDSRDLPKGLRERIRDYYKVKYPSQRVFDEEELIGQIESPSLKMAIILHLFSDVANQVHLFKMCDETVTQDLCFRMRSIYRMSEFEITRRGTVPDNLYMVRFGQVELRGIAGKRRIATTGAMFGEMAIMGLSPDGKRLRSSKALTVVELCELTKENFAEVLTVRPSFFNIVRKSCMQHIAWLEQAYEETRGSVGVSGWSAKTGHDFYDALSFINWRAIHMELGLELKSSAQRQQAGTFDDPARLQNVTIQTANFYRQKGLALDNLKGKFLMTMFRFQLHSLNMITNVAGQRGQVVIKWNGVPDVPETRALNETATFTFKQQPGVASSFELNRELYLPIFMPSVDPSRPLGLRWRTVGKQRPDEGCEIENAPLAAKLKKKGESVVEFTEKEWDELGVRNLSADNDGALPYIKVGDQYFKPIRLGYKWADLEPLTIEVYLFDQEAMEQRKNEFKSSLLPKKKKHKEVSDGAAGQKTISAAKVDASGSMLYPDAKPVLVQRLPLQQCVENRVNEHEAKTAPFDLKFDKSSGSQGDITISVVVARKPLLPTWGKVLNALMSKGASIDIASKFFQQKTLKTVESIEENEDSFTHKIRDRRIAMLKSLSQKVQAEPQGAADAILNGPNSFKKANSSGLDELKEMFFGILETIDRQNTMMKQQARNIEDITEAVQGINDLMATAQEIALGNIDEADTPAQPVAKVKHSPPPPAQPVAKVKQSPPPPAIAALQSQSSPALFTGIVADIHNELAALQEKRDRMKRRADRKLSKAKSALNKLQELEQASGGKLSDLGSPNGAALPDKGNGNKAAHRRGAKGANDRELTADEIEQARRLVKGNSFKGRV